MSGNGRRATGTGPWIGALTLGDLPDPLSVKMDDQGVTKPMGRQSLSTGLAGGPLESEGLEASGRPEADAMSVLAYEQHAPGTQKRIL